MKHTNKYVLVLMLSILISFYAIPAQATIPCPPEGCPPCSFTTCGQYCKDRSKGMGSCPDCVASCPPKAEDGPCPPGEKGCDEFKVKCNCGNGSITCHKDKKGPPGPTNTPAPTNPPPTKPPATPTPIQPTVLITIPQPSPNEIESDSDGTNMALNGKSWICLQTTACTVAGANCKGGNPEHRTLITTKKTVNGAKSPLVPNKMTYIFECLKEDNEKQYKCTTGNSALDKVTAKSDFLSTLSSKYGYMFNELTNHETGDKIDQRDEKQVPKTDEDGFLGKYEWESSTTTQIGRLMMSLQLLNEGDNISGLQKSQQLGTFTYGDENNEQVCIFIKWDPRGIVFDADSLKPIEGVKVSLYRQNPSHNFILLGSDDVFGGITNPTFTDAKGQYGFFVPNGTYKLTVEKEGYRPQYEGIPDTTYTVYDNIYTGGEIITNGRMETRHISLKQITFVDKTIKYLYSIYSSLKGAIR